MSSSKGLPRITASLFDSSRRNQRIAFGTLEHLSFAFATKARLPIPPPPIPPLPIPPLPIRLLPIPLLSTHWRSSKLPSARQIGQSSYRLDFFCSSTCCSQPRSTTSGGSHTLSPRNIRKIRNIPP